jgi:RNA polymerase sigma-70 factor (ECF subfamily)
MTGDEAMAAYARGDARAFEIVYDAVAPRLEGYLRKHVREAARVDDIIQQTFLQMHVSRGSFIPGAEVLPWAFAIAKHLMIDAQRKTRREEPHDFNDEGDTHARTMSSRAASGEDEAVARQARERMAVAYERLSPPQREALDLRTQGHSCAKAATALGTTPMGIKLRWRRALLALRAALREDDGSSDSIPPAKGRS